MHAMSSRHPHHHFTQQQHPPSTPRPSSPYQPYPPNAELLSPTASDTYVQNRSSSSRTSSTVTPNGPHLSGTRPRSPIFQTPASSNMPRSNSPPPPPPSATGHARDVVPAPSSTHIPPEDVVMTSTINFTRDHRDRPIINQYLIGHRVGKGQHGEVFKGYDMRRGNMVVAIKTCERKNSKEAKVEQLRQRNQGPIPRSAAGGGFGGVNAHARPRLVDQLQNSEKKVLREIAIMKKCKHGQIVQLYEVINDRLTKKIMLVMEYMGGGEVKWRDDHARPCLRVDQTRRICRDVVLGLLYLHHQGIIHRDIKPANLLWTADRKNVKITDFGVSHFSAAQRIDALKHSPAYQDALERRKQARRKREEEASGMATPGRRRTVWRGRGSGQNSKEDVKGKGRARDDPPPSSGVLKSDISSPASDNDHAAAEKELLDELAGDVDPILLDDGGLSRQAGTPSFLAPEIIWEYGEKQTAALYSKIGLALRKPKDEDDTELSKEEGEREDVENMGRDDADMDKAPVSSMALRTPHRLAHTDDEATPRAPDAASKTSLELPTDIPSPRFSDTEATIPDPDPSSFHDPNAVLDGDVDPDDLPPRPPITKSIDVWALGVTLYCLLFGRPPWGGPTEFAMYQMIHTEDFQVDPTMGYDRIPTGGRSHDPDDTSEGAIVIGLLDRLLEKDCTKRVTLEEVKKLPWITRDIPNPEEWLDETAPERLDPIRITSADEDVAMSTVKFRWFHDVTKPFRRFRTLLPAGRTAAARQQEQVRRRAEQHDFYDAELDGIPQHSLHIESESEKSEKASLFARRIGGSEGLSLQRKPSRSRRVVDVVERSVRKISRQSPNVSGGETPRNMKRRTLPDLMIGSRGRSLSQSQSREGSRSRPSSRASGPATPRVASGGSYSNLTSPSTAGFTSDGETDILDSDDLRAIHASRSRKKLRKEWEKEHRQKPSARQSLSNISKILNWRPKGSPRAGLSESSSKGSLGWKGLTRSPASPASPAGGSCSGSGPGSGPSSARASFATQRLARRSADEFGAPRKVLAGPSGSRAAAPGSMGMGVRSDSGPAIASAGVATAGRSPALASADELTSARRASSWGDVADEFRYDYGYGANQRSDFELDADGVSDYGYGAASAYGDYFGQGRTFSLEGGDVDWYANEDDEVRRLVGAGGVLSHPVSAGPSSPSSLSGVSAGGSASVLPQDGFSLQGVAEEVGSAGVVPASAGAPVVLSSPGVTSHPLLQDSGRRRGTSVGSRHTHHHSYVISSPLAQAPLIVDRETSLLDDELDLDDDGVSISLSRNSSAQGSIDINVERASGASGERVVVGRGLRSLKVEDEVHDNDVFADDDSSSGEDAPIEVKRRRPSEILARSRSRVRPEQPDSSYVPQAGVDDDAEIC